MHRLLTEILSCKCEAQLTESIEKSLQEKDACIAQLEDEVQLTTADQDGIYGGGNIPNHSRERSVDT